MKVTIKLLCHQTVWSREDFALSILANQKKKKKKKKKCSNIKPYIILADKLKINHG